MLKMMKFDKKYARYNGIAVSVLNLMSFYIGLWWYAHIIGTLKSKKKRYKIINKNKIINLCFRIDD